MIEASVTIARKLTERSLVTAIECQDMFQGGSGLLEESLYVTDIGFFPRAQFHYRERPDGCEYPWIFNIADFEPITGRIHQPPPVHQTFQGPNFVVCSFVPRKLDYHPISIPVPYNHSNIDSDELLYYVNGTFGSRRGIERSSISLHPRGIPHGPHPGAVETSLGAEYTDELAVMIDTFSPLKYTIVARAIDDAHYPYSWYDPVS
jgi:homogentisate 1,2-dioxygenase